MKALRIALLCGLALAGADAMACYTVYDGTGRVVWQGTDPPVDMSLPLHEAVGRRFGNGSTLVFNQTDSCTPVSIAQVARPAGGTVPPNTLRMERTGRQYSPSSEAPLFTDRQTAERQGLPHTTVAGDIVMVPPGAAARANVPTFTVIPSETTAVARADLRAPDTRALGAGPAPATGRNETVITELRNPPMTIVESRGNVVVHRD